MSTGRKKQRPLIGIELEGDALDPSVVDPLVASDVARDFVRLLNEIIQEEGLPGALHGFEVKAGSMHVQSQAATLPVAKALERSVRLHLTRREEDAGQSATPGGPRGSVHTAARLRRSIRHLERTGPVRIRTVVANKSRELRALAVDVEDEAAGEFVSVRALCMGVRADSRGSIGYFASVLDGASYQLRLPDNGTDEKLIKQYKQEVEIEAEVRDAEDRTFRGKLIDWEPLDEVEGTDLAAWKKWFQGAGWDDVAEADIEKELDLNG